MQTSYLETSDSHTCIIWVQLLSQGFQPEEGCKPREQVQDIAPHSPYHGANPSIYPCTAPRVSEGGASYIRVTCNASSTRNLAKVFHPAEE